jgi:hypothetical protein
MPDQLVRPVGEEARELAVALDDLAVLQEHDADGRGVHDALLFEERGLQRVLRAVARIDVVDHPDRALRLVGRIDQASRDPHPERFAAAPLAAHLRLVGSPLLISGYASLPMRSQSSAES